MERGLQAASGPGASAPPKTATPRNAHLQATSGPGGFSPPKPQPANQPTNQTRYLTVTSYADVPNFSATDPFRTPADTA